MSKVTLSREELYRLVWETPMSRLATQYGISGNGLAKICDRLKIPYPPRGYWARKAAGQSVITFRLPPADKETPLEARISPTVPKEQPAMPSPEISGQVARIQMEVASPSKPSRQRRHPIILNWLEAHAERFREWKRERHPYGSPPAPLTESDKRQHRLLSELFFILERAGGTLTDKQGGNIECRMSGEPINFQMREKSSLIRFPPPPGKKTGDYYYPRTELRPNGVLAFSVKTRLPGNLRCEWVEKGKSSMEGFIAEIAAILISAGPLLVEERQQREERERLERLENQRRYEEQQRLKTDRNRWRRFIEYAHRYRDIELARNFLATLEQPGWDLAETVSGRSVAEWLTWARNWIEKQDARNRGPASLFHEIAEVTSWTYRDD